MADDDGGANSDRPAMPDPLNHPAPLSRPASAKNESAFASLPPRASSKSPQHNSHLSTHPAANKSTNLDSQPMTTTSSSSSMPSDQQANNSMDATGASPYGTRSRNRTGNPRINYAEDREPEMEYEWTTKKQHAGPGPSIPNSAQSGTGDRPSAANTRRSSTTAPIVLPTNNKPAFPAVQKDHIPGMSSFSVNPEPSTAPSAPSRKRKAPANGPPPSHSSSTVTQTPAPSISRRAAGVSNHKAPRETNLMTFENCQGYLKNGKLKADDGTVLAVNGMLDSSIVPSHRPMRRTQIT